MKSIVTNLFEEKGSVGFHPRQCCCSSILSYLLPIFPPPLLMDAQYSHIPYLQVMGSTFYCACIQGIVIWWPVLNTPLDISLPSIHRMEGKEWKGSVM